MTPTAPTLEALYESKVTGYFATARPDLLALHPVNPGARVLEIGAGNGATLSLLKQSIPSVYAVGIELMPVASASEGPAPDLMLQGNIEQMDLTELGLFDLILCADVLEHLTDPWAAVSKLTQSLKPGGVLLASLPNVRNYRVLRQIAWHGSFRYESAGLFDRTHLRFFCRQDALELMSRAGLVPEVAGENLGPYGIKHRLVDAATLHLLHDFFVFQWLIRARKPSA
jgi:2-polyprenyl-3-methyl-5-hydroxy-6-metoxy-1,4-benzoquinol methylase